MNDTITQRKQTLKAIAQECKDAGIIVIEPIREDYEWFIISNGTSIISISTADYDAYSLSSSFNRLPSRDFGSGCQLTKSFEPTINNIKNQFNIGCPNFGYWVQGGYKSPTYYTNLTQYMNKPNNLWYEYNIFNND